MWISKYVLLQVIMKLRQKYQYCNILKLFILLLLYSDLGIIEVLRIFISIYSNDCTVVWIKISIRTGACFKGHWPSTFPPVIAPSIALCGTPTKPWKKEDLHIPMYFTFKIISSPSTETQNEFDFFISFYVYGTTQN